MNNIIYNISPIHIKSLYSSINYKTKEKVDMILEPLQSMIQLAILSVCPIGTKLTIQQNILYLQMPNIIQPLSRWYNSDKKDDIFFLFQVIRRFIKWYNINNNRNSPISAELYQLIIKMSMTGLDNILKTYNTSDNNTIMQVIYMYKNLLEPISTSEVDRVFNEKNVNMDEIFNNIITLYNPILINLIHNALNILNTETDENDINNFINGLNLILTKNNKLIQNWIKSNLIV